MAERAHRKPLRAGIPRKDDRPSQLLSFKFLYDKSIAEDPETYQPDQKNEYRLQSNEISFFHSQKSVWFRQLLK